MLRTRFVSRMRFMAAFLACALLAGCAARTTDGQSPSPGGMGMGGTGKTAGPGMGLGVVAAEGSAVLELAESSVSTRGVEVQRVISPSRGWLVIVSLEPGAGILGKLEIPSGESSDLVVPLDTLDASLVRVRLQVDRGAAGEFEYDPRRPERSPDKPVFVGDECVEGDIALIGYGIEAPQNFGWLSVKDQRLDKGSVLHIEYARLPGPSWIAAHIMVDGVPGPLVGWVQRGAGESFDVRLPVKGVSAGDMLMVTVHVDRGAIGEFEYQVDDPLVAVDQPYVSNGIIVAENITIR